MLIIHGDKQVQARQKLASLIDKSRSEGRNINRLEAKKLELKDLELALGSSGLFANNDLIIIEGLHSLLTSKRKTNLISYIVTSANSADRRNSELDNLILFESRSLTATMLKKFAGAKVEEFKATKYLFAWLDSLNPDRKTLKKQVSLLQNALKSDGEHFCFLMLARQIRMLIQIKDGGTVKGAPFMISKLKSQAAKFSIKQLLTIHKKLFEIDLAQKNSQNYLPLSKELELLIINM